MKTYKQFITEVEILPKIIKSKGKTISGILGLRLYGLGKTVKSYPPSETHGAKLLNVDTLKSGHKVYHYDLGDEMLYHVVNPKSRHISTALITYKHGNGAEEIHRVATTYSMQRNKNRLPLHKLYHHLITKHDKVLSSSQQSPGGMKAWRKLSHMPDVNIHGWDKEFKEPVNIPMHLTKDNSHETHVLQNYPQRRTPELDRLRYASVKKGLINNKKLSKDQRGELLQIRHHDYNTSRNDDLDYYQRMRKLSLVAHKKD